MVEGKAAGMGRNSPGHYANAHVSNTDYIIVNVNVSICIAHYQQ